MHIVHPALSFRDWAKTRISVDDPDLLKVIAEALWSVAKVPFQNHKKKEQQDAQATKRMAEIARTQTVKVSLKDLVFAALPEAIAQATGDGEYPVSARNLLYAVRPLIADRATATLRHSYFAQDLLTEYHKDKRRN